MKKILLLSLLLVTTIGLTSCSDSEIPLTEAQQAEQYNMSTTEFKEMMKLQKLRFNLYESFARKFNKKINKIKFRNDKSYSDLEKIGYEIYEELLKTEDSIIYCDLPREEAIKYWNKKINNRLKNTN